MPRDLARSLQRTLTHLKPPPIKGGQHGAPIPTHFRPNPKFVQVKDRKAFWHIAPEDKVVLIRGPAELKGVVGTVDQVDRATNRVFLKENQFAAKKRQMNQYPGEAFGATHNPSAVVYIPRSYHLDNFRLQVEDAGLTHTVTRMKRSAVTWDRRFRRFSWKRYGLVPALIHPGSEGVEGEPDVPRHSGWLQIAWPKEKRPSPSTPGVLDTLALVSGAQSFFPSLLALKTLASPTRFKKAKEEAVPPELAIGSLDLNGGAFSRAARTKRFNLQKAEMMVFSKAERKLERKQSAMEKIGRKLGEIELV